MFDNGLRDAPTLAGQDLREGAAVPTGTQTPGATTTVRRIDELTTRLVATVHDGTGHPAADDPTACLDLVRATVARRGGIGRTYKSEAAVQHLFSTVWQYGLFFAPGPDWQLVEADPAQAQLRWRHAHQVVDSNDVLDVVSAAGHPDVAALPHFDTTAVRLVNLANRSASLVWLPQAASPQPWTASLDPLNRSTTRVATPSGAAMTVAVAA